MSKKEQMCAALYAFIGQPSGIEFRNYQSGDWKQSRECFMGDYRPILKYGRHARAMLRAVEIRPCITPEQLQEATRAYAGRLQFIERDGAIAVNYITGQYFPTEYRAAACAVLARCLWDYWQFDCKTPEEIRKRAKHELGPGIAKTWFN